MNRTTGMRKISLIVIHCSATREDKELTAFDLDTMHRRRGFNGTGYHYYIRKDGTTLLTRPIERIGAHVRGTPGGHTDTGTAGSAPAAGASVAREIPRLPGVRSS